MDNAHNGALLAAAVRVFGRRLAGMTQAATKHAPVLAGMVWMMVSTPLQAAVFATDDFDTAGYSGGHGWSGDWSESIPNNPDPGPACGGPEGADADDRICVHAASGTLRLHGGSGRAQHVHRGIDLSAVDIVSATLVFDLAGGGLEDDDSLEVSISADGGNQWTSLAVYSGNIAFTTERLDISAFLSSGTRVRFGVSGGTAETGEYFLVDDVSIRGQRELTAPAQGAVAYDYFDAGVYTGGGGWNGGWRESGDDGLAGAGNIFVDSGRLLLRGDDDAVPSFVSRTLDLSDAANALLIFDITVDGGFSVYEPEDEIEIYTRGSPADPWTRIRQFNTTALTLQGLPRSNHVVQIPAADLSPTTELRIGVATEHNSGSGVGEHFVIDHIRIYAAPVSLDFETDELAGGAPLGNGNNGPSQVFDADHQPYGDDGITITLGNSIHGPLMLFDSVNPTGGDGDLGSPNPQPSVGESCGAGDPIIAGEYGVIGGPGENCVPLGNLLIISEDGDVDEPNDSPEGGIIRYAFDRPIAFTAIMFVDDILPLPPDNPAVTLHFAGGSSVTRAFSAFDDLPGNGTNGKHWASFVDFGAAGPIAGVTGIDIDLADTSGATRAFFITDPGVDFGDAPESYGTSLAGNGPRHLIDSSRHVRLGVGIDSESDGQPSERADGDDAVAVGAQDDEDGISLPTSSSTDGDGDDTVYTASVTASNLADEDALLCAWMDVNQDGGFDNTANTSTSGADPGSGNALDIGERSCVLVAAGTTAGTFTVSWTIAGSERGNTGRFYFRFRIATDPAFRTAPSAHGEAADGEIEDIQTDVDTVPVTLGHFSSRLTGGALHAEWTTVSEAFNVGFELWASIGGRWELLTTRPVLSTARDAVSVQRYRVTVPLRGLDPAAIDGVALSTIETDGGAELFGMFETGIGYGEAGSAATIPWQAIRALHDRRMAALGFRKAAGGWRRRGDVPADRPLDVRHAVLDVLVEQDGMQRLTYEQMAAAGFDLAGTSLEHIAVTLKGDAVARRVFSPGGRRFGPGGHIDFWGRMPTHPDAQYVNRYVYRVAVDPTRTKAATGSDLVAETGRDRAPRRVVVEEDAGYNFVNPLPAPWYAKELRHPWGPLAYAVDVTVADDLVDDGAARIEAVIAGLTDFDGRGPDHRVRLTLNGRVVAEESFDGSGAMTIAGEVPAGLLASGPNRVEVSLPGDTGVPFDIVVVDRVTLRYPRRLVAEGNRVHVEDAMDADALSAHGFDSHALIAYARRANGELVQLTVGTERDDAARADRRGTRGWRATIATLPAPQRDPQDEYWISTQADLPAPLIVGASRVPDLLAEDASLLVIAHPVFLPDADDRRHPLNEYFRHRRSQGWSVRLVSIADIQHVHGGMPLPDALTRFLRAADRAFSYSHVLLVGGDSYDYLDRLGLGSISFIPTAYGAVGRISHAPLDHRLADIDGDRIGDKAIGRWPVRSLDDLAAVVRKTLDWESLPAATGQARTSLWITDSQDARLPSFAAQAERMIERLESPGAGGRSEPWPADNITRIYFDEIEPLPGRSVAESARAALLEALAGGQTITGFIGHGSPSSWTFQGLLRARHVSDLRNEGRPTLITTLTCYTSYFVSPHAETLANRLMNGFRLDSRGRRIGGVANGAVAVHGAATLSSFRNNERLAADIIRWQLLDGDTLGEAIRRSRSARLGDAAESWTLLGDPTLTIGGRFHVPVRTSD